MPHKRIIDKEILEHLYVRKYLTLKQVAEKLHASSHTVSRNMIEHDIPARTCSEVATRHSMSATRPYHIWQAMKTRCTNKRQPNFRNYGSRGISYPSKWETFEGFWRDMSDGYADDRTLDRTDNSLSYSKANCRWTTCQAQSRNKSDNVLLTYQNKTQCITSWSEELGVPRHRLYQRKKMGWSDDRILTTPAQTQFIRGKHRIRTE